MYTCWLSPIADMHVVRIDVLDGWVQLQQHMPTGQEPSLKKTKGTATGLVKLLQKQMLGFRHVCWSCAT